jgi:hypothetical protein
MGEVLRRHLHKRTSNSDFDRRTAHHVPKLSHELRNLPNARHRFSPSGARQLKIAVEGLKKTDFADLAAAANVANTELDRIIARGTMNVEQGKPVEQSGEPVDAAADVEQDEAA